jgi:hypothetical protein
MIRNFQETDLEVLRKLHSASGASWAIPDLDSPLVLVRKVVDENGAKMIGIGELHISALLWVDKQWRTPQERLNAMQELQHEMMLEAAKFGLDTATLQADGRFAERMSEMGWTEATGKMFYRRLP